MKTVNILLGTINDVKNFVNIVSQYDFDVDLISGRYAIDAKSIMGIFSLDLAKPIKAEIHSDNCEKFLEEIKPFIVEYQNHQKHPLAKQRVFFYFSLFSG